jgi:uncharacterized secreted protein with C-terminal beta-propeller domain
MVQREIKNKTKLYTVAAILSAIILVSAIYTATTPAVMYGLIGSSPMKTFTSNDELRNYLVTNTQRIYYAREPIDAQENEPIAFQERSPNGATGSSGPIADSSISAPSGAYSVAPSSADIVDGYWRGTGSSLQDPFSTTNTQVVGVDEADIVKTDGQYIYTLSQYGALGSTIHIVKASSQTSAVVGKIVFDNSTRINGMYLSENGNKLVLVGRIYDYNRVYYSSYGSNIVQSFLYVYDVSSKVEPVLVRNLTLSGNYFNSRMIGSYVYAVVNQRAYVVDDGTVILPQLCVDAATTEIAPASIYYTDVQDTYFSYSTFIGLNIMDNAEQPTYLTILTGASSCMYVSTNNMYVTFGKSEGTEIYRVAFNRAALYFSAQGIVSGRVLNQYSMDEYNDYFRIATTVSTGSWNNREEHNNLYVLNLNLDVVGKLENLAQGERIYSARFAGDKAYLVTFRQIDPFFVIDLKNPISPSVAGELKIPGFSNYLHPYNEKYVIGLGQEESRVKLSLFDVTDMNDPKEIAKYIIGEDARSSSSAAQNNPKAFLFDQQKQLLVIPVTVYNYYTPSQSSDSSTSDLFADRRNSVWQGAYVFKVSPGNGFMLQGELSHPTIDDNSWSNNEPITRSLYIGNTLYTISNSMIQLHRLDNLELIAQVNF